MLCAQGKAVLWLQKHCISSSSKPEAAAAVSWQLLSVCVLRPPTDLPRPLGIVSGLQNWLEIQAVCFETTSKGS